MRPASDPPARSTAAIAFAWGRLAALASLLGALAFDPVALSQTPPPGEVKEIVERLRTATGGEDRIRILTNSPLPLADVARGLARWSRQIADRGRFAEAMELNEAAMEIAVMAKDPSSQGEVRRHRGFIFLRHVKPGDAVTEYEQAVALFRSANDSAGEVVALSDLAKAQAVSGEPDEGRNHCSQAIEIARRVGDPLGEAIAHQSLAEVERRAGRFGEALSAIEFAVAYFASVTNLAELAESRLKLADVLTSTGRHRDAEPVYRAVINSFRLSGDQAGEAIALGNLGVLLELTGRYPDALQTYDSSLRLKEGIEDVSGQVMTLNNIGVVYQQMGRYREARGYYEASERLAGTSADPADRARALHNLGGLSQLMGRYAESLRYLQASLRLEEAAHNILGAAESRGSIAIVLRQAGRLDEAQQEFESILPVFQREGARHDEAETWHHLGHTRFLKAHLDEAVEALDESLRLKQEIEDHAGQAASRNQLGLVHQAGGRLVEARNEFEKARELAVKIGARPEEARARLNLGELSRLQAALDDAADQFQQAAGMAGEADDLEALASAHLGLARVARQRGQWRAAAEACRLAVAAAEEIRANAEEPSLQISFFSQHSEPYVLLVECLLRLGEPEAAWQTAERARARTLLSLLGSAGTAITTSMSPDERATEESLNGRIGEWNLTLRSLLSLDPPDVAALDRARRQLAGARRDFEQYRRRLYLDHPQLAVHRGAPPSVELDGLSPRLPPGSLVLEYVLGDEQGWVFMLRPATGADPARAAKAELQVRPLAIGRKGVATLARALRERMVRQSPRVPAPEARQLFDLLLAPALRGQDGVSRICVVPDGPLWDVPFAALSDAESRPLVERFAWLQVPSVATWLSMARRAAENAAARRPMDLLVLANPKLVSTRQTEDPLLGGFEEIPGTERQARRIATLFGGQTRLLLGSGATEENARAEAPRHRFLHFATHGVFEPANPMFSGLVLARTPGGREDGYWEAREILASDLHADLAVLSACDTARGEVRAGEGLLGLTWALFVAGCPATVASQWAVSDASTADLMIEFYRRLQSHLLDIPAGGAPSRDELGFAKAEALRQAQLTLLRSDRWAHPFHWAPFIVIGDAR